MAYSILEWLSRPSRKQLVRRLVSCTAGLELIKGEHRSLPPVMGSFGPFKFKGNSNPEITYLTFDDALMEFVNVSVFLNLPDRITFEATTADLGSVRVKDAYKGPFFEMAYQIYRYFPLLPEEGRNLVSKNQGA